MHPKIGTLCFSTFLAMLVCAGCTPLFSKNPEHWRDGRIGGIVSRAALPASIDEHCLGTSDSEHADKSKVAIVAIHLGRRMPSYRLAMPIADGRPLIHVGDDVIVQPLPCKLEVAQAQGS
jgi:hypothetical protein